MLEFMSTRTKIAAGIGIAGVVAAVVSGVVDYKQFNAEPAATASVSGTDPEAVKAAVGELADAVEETTADIVG